MENRIFSRNNGSTIVDRQGDCLGATASNQKKITISIIDTHPDSNGFFKEYIETVSWLRLGQWCRPNKEALKTMRSFSCDAILFDADPLEICSDNSIRDLKRECYAPIVVMFGRHADPVACFRCFLAGADGYFAIPGTRHAFIETLQAALNGWKPTPPEVHRRLVEQFICASFSKGRGKDLTRSEREVMSCISLGLIDKDIATARGTSERTVHAITNSIFRKLGVHNRRDAVNLLSQNQDY